MWAWLVVTHVGCKGQIMFKIIRRRFSSLVAGGTREKSKAKWQRSKDRRFIDWKRVVLRGGNGGSGCVSFKRSGKVRYGPADGGNGGHGGGVVFTAHTSVRTLKPLKNHYHGNIGSHGQGACHTGKSGRDIFVQVPPGTVIKDSMTGSVLADLLECGDTYRAVPGGEGGLGNAMFAGTDNRRPIECTEGVNGHELTVEVELRTIADVGLVGFPNAGKSTLLRAITRASPTVAAYPFTTLNPQVGVVMGNDDQLAVADIPGLIPGAHANKGLGHSFLRHIERCSCLLYILDSSSTETSIASQYDALQLELQLYDAELLKNIGLVVINKMDACVSESSSQVSTLESKTGLPVVPVSGLHAWNLNHLKEALFRIVSQRRTH